ncbi:MAG: serine hydrolase [Acidobacteria bacterium]|nr:serine hydrolase [Acidobacteriota bacterium]
MRAARPGLPAAALRALSAAAAVLALSVLPGFAQTSAKATSAKKSPSSPAAKAAIAAKPLASKTTQTKTDAKRKTTYSAAAARARRASLARSRAAAYLAQPRFKTDANGAVVPDIRAEAAIIYNPETGQVLWEEKAFDQRSIASITKVMTAVCVVEDSPDLAEEFMVDRADTRGASVTYLKAYERVSVQNLLHLALIASDNAAARMLARVSPRGTAGLVARMNEKAAELGLKDTRYVPSWG